MALTPEQIDAEAFARWGEMKGAPLAMCRGFARTIEAEARRDALEEAAKKCDEMLEHYSALKDTALLNGDVALSNASSGEPRACEFLATAIRKLKEDIQ